MQWKEKRQGDRLDHSLACGQHLPTSICEMGMKTPTPRYSCRNRQNRAAPCWRPASLRKGMCPVSPCPSSHAQHRGRAEEGRKGIPSSLGSRLGTLTKGACSVISCDHSLGPPAPPSPDLPASPQAPHTPYAPSWVRAEAHKASRGLCAWLLCPGREREGTATPPVRTPRHRQQSNLASQPSAKGAETPGLPPSLLPPCPLQDRGPGGRTKPGPPAPWRNAAASVSLEVGLPEAWGPRSVVPPRSGRAGRSVGGAGRDPGVEAGGQPRGAAGDRRGAGGGHLLCPGRAASVPAEPGAA